MDMGDESTSEVEKLIQFLGKAFAGYERFIIAKILDSSGTTQDKQSIGEAVGKVERIAAAQGLDPDQLSLLMQFILGDSVTSTYVHVSGDL